MQQRQEQAQGSEGLHTKQGKHARTSAESLQLAAGACIGKLVALTAEPGELRQRGRRGFLNSGCSLRVLRLQRKQTSLVLRLRRHTSARRVRLYARRRCDRRPAEAGCGPHLVVRRHKRPPQSKQCRIPLCVENGRHFCTSATTSAQGACQQACRAPHQQGGPRS